MTSKEVSDTLSGKVVLNDKIHELIKYIIVIRGNRMIVAETLSSIAEDLEDYEWLKSLVRRLIVLEDTRELLEENKYRLKEILDEQ